MRVAYLGPKGTYSSEAAYKQFNKFEDSVCSSLEEVVRKVADGDSDYGVLPIENSTNGPVNLALQILIKYAAESKNLSIQGQTKVNIKHQLYTNALKTEQIKEVYSHPQVWGQTAEFTANLLSRCKLTDCASTAQAVKLALNDTTGQIAAFGGPQSSLTQPLISDCSDFADNTTRFLIISKLPPHPHQQNVNTPKPRYNVYVCKTTKLEEYFKLLKTQDLKFVYYTPSTIAWHYDIYFETKEVISQPWAKLIGGVDD